MVAIHSLGRCTKFSKEVKKRFEGSFHVLNHNVIQNELTSAETVEEASY
jgi:hypothetical protein